MCTNIKFIVILTRKGSFFYFPGCTMYIKSKLCSVNVLNNLMTFILSSMKTPHYAISFEMLECRKNDSPLNCLEYQNIWTTKTCVQKLDHVLSSFFCKYFALVISEILSSSLHIEDPYCFYEGSFQQEYLLQKIRLKDKWPHGSWTQLGRVINDQTVINDQDGAIRSLIRFTPASRHLYCSICSFWHRQTKFFL